MRHTSAILSAILAVAPFCLAAETAGPTAAYTGAEGPHTYYYWQVPMFEGGLNAMGKPMGPTLVNGAAVLGEANTVELTPQHVEGAVEYWILRSQLVEAPVPKVSVLKKGTDTVYYWLVVRQGWYRSAPSKPVEAQGCDGQAPDNKVTWEPPSGGPYTYDLLRTPTRHLPLGHCSASVAFKYAKTKFADTHPVRAMTRVYAAGNFCERAPFGAGRYLLAKTRAPAVTDKGQPLGQVVLLAGDRTGMAGRTFNVKNPPEQYLTGGIGHRGFGIETEHNESTNNYTFGNQIALHVSQTARAGGINDYFKRGTFLGSARAKTFYNAIQSDQHCYTHAQHIARFTSINGYACGDNALEVAVINTHAGNRDGGDEGSEFFSYQVQRLLNHAAFSLTEDAPRASTKLPVTVDKHTTLGTGRVLINLSKTYKEGYIRRIDNDIPERAATSAYDRTCILHGHQTQWTPEMEGGYISLDTDTIDGTHRNWHLVVRYVSPTELHILPFTYYSQSIYKGYAQNVVEHGIEYRGGDKSSAKPANWKDVAIRKDDRILEPYIFAHGTEIDDPAGLDGEGRLTVLPLSVGWSKGDKLRIAAGPAATVGVGNLLFHGKLLPQDQLKGLLLLNFTNRMADGAGVWALGKGWRWGFRADLAESGDSCGFYVGDGKARPDEGCLSMPADTTGVRFRNVPVTVSGNAEAERIEFTSAWTKEEKGTTVLSVSPTAVRVHDGAVLQGNGNTRGREAIRGDGKTKVFTVVFPAAYGEAPVVTFSTDDFTPSRLAGTAVSGFTVEFALPVPDGHEVVLSWIAQL